MKVALMSPERWVDIPDEVWAAADTIFNWAELNGHKDWKLKGVASRKYTEQLERRLKRYEKTKKQKEIS